MKKKIFLEPGLTYKLYFFPTLSHIYLSKYSSLKETADNKNQ